MSLKIFDNGMSK